MYLGRLARLSTGWRGQVWRNVDGRWKLLGMRPVTRGSGLLQFDVVGSRLTLSYNGQRLIDVHDNAITRPGSAGVRISGIANRLDDFLGA
jgi:hypothetical protein